MHEIIVLAKRTVKKKPNKMKHNIKTTPKTIISYKNHSNPEEAANVSNYYLYKNKTPG